jgi:hypothetical protein
LAAALLAVASGCTTGDGADAPPVARAPAIGKADSLDAADTDCRIVLRTASENEWRSTIDSKDNHRSNVGKQKKIVPASFRNKAIQITC